MENVKLLFFLGTLVFAEATVNVCIPLQASDVTGASVDDVFKGIVSNISKKYPAEENKPNLVIEHVDVNITHPAAHLVGALDDVKLYNFHDFRICFLDNIYLNSSYYQFDVFNLTFNNLRIEGTYNLTGDIGDIFDVFGAGDFWINLYNLSLAMVNFTINISDEICFPINLEIDLQEIQNHLNGLMDDEELETLFNEVISDIIPDALKVLWPEWEELFDKGLEDEINEIIHDILHPHNVAPVLSMLKSAQNGKLTASRYCYPED